MQVFASAQVAYAGEASVTAAPARTAVVSEVDPPQPGCALQFTCVFVAAFVCEVRVAEVWPSVES